MGQAAQRKHYHHTALQHLKQFGIDQHGPAPDDGAAAHWLHRHFVGGLRQAANAGPATWHNQVYLEAQRHADGDIRRGIRALMNDVLTAGLEQGRVVFALLADVELARPEVVGEFDSCEALAQWVCAQLNVPRMNVRVRHNASMVPARAGLFGLIPTLELITAEKSPGELPNVVTRKAARPELTHQRLVFLVSVYTSAPLELDLLDTARTGATGETASAPGFELSYWGPEDATPEQRARVTPQRAVQLFDALEMLGFWEPLQHAQDALAPMRQAAEAAALPALPVLQVQVRSCAVPGLAGGAELALRWRDLDMAEVPVYRGGFAEYFVAQLDRLGARVERVPGLMPAREEEPLFAPDGSLNPQHEAYAREAGAP